MVYPLPSETSVSYMMAPYPFSPYYKKGEKVPSRTALHKIIDYGMPRAADEG